MEIVINFKNYKVGDKALKLAKAIEKYIPKAIICVPTLDIELIKQKTKLRVFAQHADFQEGDKTTGYNTLLALKKAGVKGTLINHSEHPLSLKEIIRTVVEAKKLKLRTVVCVPNLRDVGKIIKFKPYAIAFEDPKLISTGKSVTKYNPKSLLEFVKIMKKTKIMPLCGAGISTSEDVIQARALGCKGVLMASAIANSKSPEKLLMELKRIK